MSNEFMREERYIVFKMSDLGNSLKGDEIRRLAREYAEQRRLKGKKPLECVVVEKDWPEYEPTWKAIEARVTGAQPAPSFADAYQGAMEEVAIWKKRALEAEDLNRKFVAEINGPTYMGEPAQPAPSVPELIESLRCACNYIDKLGGVSQQYRAMLAAVPEAKPSVPDGWKEAAIAWEVCGSLHREYAKGKDPFFKKRQEDFVKHANDARAMIAAAPEAGS